MLDKYLYPYSFKAAEYATSPWPRSNGLYFATSLFQQPLRATRWRSIMSENIDLRAYSHAELKSLGFSRGVNRDMPLINIIYLRTVYFRNMRYSFISASISLIMRRCFPAHFRGASIRQRIAPQYSQTYRDDGLLISRRRRSR